MCTPVGGLNIDFCAGPQGVLNIHRTVRWSSAVPDLTSGEAHPASFPSVRTTGQEDRKLAKGCLPSDDDSVSDPSEPVSPAR